MASIHGCRSRGTGLKMHQNAGFRICNFKSFPRRHPELPLREGRPPPAPSAMRGAASPLLWPTSVLGPMSPVPPRFRRLSTAPGPHGTMAVTCWNVFDRTKHSEQKLGKKTVSSLISKSQVPVLSLARKHSSTTDKTLVILHNQTALTYQYNQPYKHCATALWHNQIAIIYQNYMSVSMLTISV